MPTDEESAIAEIKARLRARGWYVRYTEWTSGHQVVIHRRSDTADHRVTAWRPSEVEAWREALAQALASEEPDVATPIEVEPESPIGRTPSGRPGEGQGGAPARSGAGIRREEGDESEAGSEIRDRERSDPPTIRGVE